MSISIPSVSPKKKNLSPCGMQPRNSPAVAFQKLAIRQRLYRKRQPKVNSNINYVHSSSGNLLDLMFLGRPFSFCDFRSADCLLFHLYLSERCRGVAATTSSFGKCKQSPTIRRRLMVRFVPCQVNLDSFS